MAHSEAAERPLSILLLTRSLETGGAQHQLVELAIGLSERGHRVRVVVFYGGGPLTKRLEDAAVELTDLRKAGRWHFVGFLRRAISVVRALKPDVIYSFLGDANIIGAVIRPFTRHTKLVWSIRNSEFDASVDHWLAGAGFGVEAALSRSPSAIIANSVAGRDFAIRRGFPADRIQVVSNGIDTDRFRPDERIRLEQRGKWGIAADQVAVGVLARLNATKGYPTFLRAVARVAAADPKVRFFAIGGGEDREGLHSLASELGIADRVIFTGETDPAAALNALDIACSTSNAEGFSNAIAEAMACGLPSIVTDVGDSAAIVGDLGTVVPPGSPGALAEAILAAVASLGRHDPARARARIVDNFSLATMVDRTLAVFEALQISR